MNNKSASIRALLHQNPDGMDYEELSRHTGVARDKISAFVAALIGQGDVKPYEVDGRRIFKYCGDPKRVGPRDEIERQPVVRKVDFNLDAAPGSPAPAKKGNVVTHKFERKESAGADLQALTLQNIIAAASVLAACVREHVELDESEELKRAVKGFELAERIHEAAAAQP
jgi:hypothetical protein